MRQHGSQLRRHAHYHHGRAIETFASYCRVLSVKREKKATWRVRTSCRGEGEMENEPRTRVTYTLRLNGDKLTMREGTTVWNFVRCKKLGAPRLNRCGNMNKYPAVNTLPHSPRTL